jgi:hypothetical protein
MTALMAIFMSVLLVAPIAICYVLITRVDNTDKAYAGCIVVLLGFTLLFIVSMITLSTAKRHEILAGTAASVSSY